MNEVIKILMNYILDKDKMNLMRTCKEFLKFRTEVTYTGVYDYDKIKHLTFTNNFRHVYYVYVSENPGNPEIPECVTILDIKNTPIMPNLSNRIREIRFLGTWETAPTVPVGLRCAVFRNHFKTVDNTPIILPNTIKSVICGPEFAGTVTPMHGVNRIVLGRGFATHIPDSVHTLSLSNLNNVIPESVKSLSIDVDDVSDTAIHQFLMRCPKKLKHLYIRSADPFMGIMDPDYILMRFTDLDKLRISVDAQELHVPDSISRLQLFGNIGNFNMPSKIKSLTLPRRFNEPLVFPDSLVKLNLSRNYSYTIGELPKLRILFVGPDFNQPILPTSLVNLTCNYIPDNFAELVNLESFKMIGQFNSPIHVFPPNLKVVSFGMKFNQPVILPESLFSVRFNGQYSQPVVIPKTVRILYLGVGFSGNIEFSRRLRKFQAHVSYGGVLPKATEIIVMGFPRKEIKIYRDGRICSPIQYPILDQLNETLRRGRAKKITIGSVVITARQ